MSGYHATQLETGERNDTYCLYIGTTTGVYTLAGYIGTTTGVYTLAGYIGTTTGVYTLAGYIGTTTGVYTSWVSYFGHFYQYTSQECVSHTFLAAFLFQRRSL